MKIHEIIRANKAIGLQDDPQFDRSSRYDWRRYVPDDIRLLWKEMAVESRIITMMFAENLARQRRNEG